MSQRRVVRLVVFLLATIFLAASPAVAQQLKVVTGVTVSGAQYEFIVPPNWNRDLVVYAHGYTDPGKPVAFADSGLRDYVLSKGYAYAASSFSANGWAVKEGAAETHQLKALFTAKIGRPHHTLLAGVSMGSLIVVELAERYPRQYDGALAMCGVLGGTQAEIQYMGNARILYDFVYKSNLFGQFPYTLPGDYPHPQYAAFDPGTPAYDGTLATLAAGATPPLFPTMQWAATAGLQADFNNPAEVITAGMNVLGFLSVGEADFLNRTHGQLPYGNNRYVYSDPLAPSFGDLVNAEVPRYHTTLEGFLFTLLYYQPTGDLDIPMYTLHTSRDPIVPAWHESLYSREVAFRGHGRNLSTHVVDGFGHCVFQPTDVLSSFDALESWVKQGVHP